MKYIYLYAFLLMGSITFSQIDTTTPIEDEVKLSRKESRSVDKATDRFNQTKDAYQKAVKNLNEATEEKIKRTNELESARVAMRQASLALALAKKQASPIKVNRYDVNVNPIFEEMSKGMNYGLSTYIEGTETSGLFSVFSKHVDQEFKSYLKQFKSSKVKKQKGELFFDNIIIPEMSATTMDVYVDFIQKNEGVSIRTYFDMGDTFLNTNDNDNKTVRYAKKLMDQFARHIRTKSLEDEIRTLEKDLEKNQKDLQRIKKEIVDSKETIQDAEAEINDAYHTISAIESQIDQLNDKLELKRLKLGKVN